ncbi:MAG: 50S ribosomal protein L19 [Microgenomates bacterium 39_7]|nr:MAG: 50S ribosomal protein L19 [Microgenomates bacterium 39_7]
MSLKFKHQDTVASIGDTIQVHQEIVEGDNKRVQVFEGIVIAIKNRDRNKSFTVRKIGANSIGVEKIFPVYLPSIKEIKVIRKGRVKRSKLYFLRDKVGKAATKVKEKKEYEKKSKSKDN